MEEYEGVLTLPVLAIPKEASAAHENSQLLAQPAAWSQKGCGEDEIPLRCACGFSCAPAGSLENKNGIRSLRSLCAFCRPGLLQQRPARFPLHHPDRGPECRRPPLLPPLPGGAVSLEQCNAWPWEIMRKVLMIFGEGLILGPTPSPAVRPLRPLYGHFIGEGPWQKNRPSPNSPGTVMSDANNSLSEANRRLLPPAPLPRRGVWGEGNVDEGRPRREKAAFRQPFAERTRFELVVQNNPYGSLANCWFQPLTHLSGTANIQTF